MGIVGNLGCGKTIMMTTMGYMMVNSGYNVYANYHLNFPYTYIDSVDILDLIEKSNNKNVLLLDELWISADSRQTQQDRNIIISRAIAQSRKKKCMVFYTVQWISQIESRIKTLTNMLFHPKIFLADKDGVPIALKVSAYYREIMGDLEYIKDFYLYTYGIHKMYDTAEIIEPAKDVRLLKFIKLYDKEKYSSLRKSELFSIILLDNRSLTKSDAQTIVDYISAKAKVR
jgi:hypothetical protein